MKLSIIIVTHNSQEEIEKVVQSIFNSCAELDYEIIIIDNNSGDDTLAKVSNISKRVKIIANSRNVGFGRANNQGFKVANGEFILVLNPDIILTEQTRVNDLCEKLLTDREIGIIAPRLIYPDGSVQESVRGFPNLLVQVIRVLKADRFFNDFRAFKNYMLLDKKLSTEIYVDWVIGAFMLIRRDLLFEIGLFDTRFFMYMEDADLCLSLKRKGYKICYSPMFSAVHSYKRESSKSFFSPLRYAHIKSSLKFYLKNGYWH